MSAAGDNPTPYPEVNSLLKELLESVQAVLDNHFIGMYLDGSLAGGGFDQDSDIDFVVVSDEDISGDPYLELQTMHDRIATIDSEWAIQLEGSYVSQRALRRYDPAEAAHPNIERGRGERLKMVPVDKAWDIHRSALREHGIILAGPAPQTLIDPVTSNDLRRGALKELNGWIAELLTGSVPKDRGGQSYIVLTLCRILYTLENGSVVSKLTAARWAEATLGERWVPLIERTWEGRHQPGLEASAEDVKGTLEFIHYSLARSQRQ